MANEVFEIEVLNWEKHKGGLKKNHAYFPVAKRIFDDHKVATLTPVERLLYVILLARCADDYSAVIRPTRQQLTTSIGQSRYDVVTALQSLERNQLVRLLNLPSNRKEKKRKEKKIKENKGREIQETPAAQVAIAPAQIGKILVAHYCDEYRKRYSVNPVIRPQDGKLLKNLGESVGEERAKALINAYIAMNNSWFITKAHDVATLIANLNQVQNFLATGQVVTAQDAKNAEASESLKNQIRRLAGGDYDPR